MNFKYNFKYNFKGESPPKEKKENEARRWYCSTGGLLA